MFKGLNNDQMYKIFRICHLKKINKDEILCNAGDESNHVFILISGFLQATFVDGSKLSRISPLWTVGEMGVFSGEKRSATVIADSDCLLLEINSDLLFQVFNMDPVIGKIVAININKYLSHKLRTNQAIIEELKVFCPEKVYGEIIARVTKLFG